MNSTMQNLRQEILEQRLERESIINTTAKIRMLDALNALKPSYNVPCSIIRQGSRWLCVLESSDEFMDCPSAYGESPKQSMENFDLLWNGQVPTIDPGEDSPEPEEF